MSPPPPEELEEYRIVRPLGRGGMGEVFLAEDRLLARLVAVKLIAAASPSEATRARFFVEARAVARLSHPNVVAVHRVGEVSRRPFLVSEYVRGQTLAEIDKPVPSPRALEIAVGPSAPTISRTATPRAWPRRWSTPALQSSSSTNRAIRIPASAPGVRNDVSAGLTPRSGAAPAASARR